MTFFAVTYKFTLKRDDPMAHAEFVDVWTEMTHIFAAHCGALGSRLHKCDALTYFAYAQWPSKSTYEADLNEKTEAALVPLRARFAKVCTPTEVVLAGDVITDLLQPHMK